MAHEQGIPTIIGLRCVCSAKALDAFEWRVPFQEALSSHYQLALGYRLSHVESPSGRLFYVIKFKGLNLDFVKSYAEENLKNRAHVEKVCVVAAVFGACNLDMLKGLIEEMNRNLLDKHSSG